jgi:hypothetical protein
MRGFVRHANPRDFECSPVGIWHSISWHLPAHGMRCKTPPNQHLMGLLSEEQEYSLMYSRANLSGDWKHVRYAIAGESAW